MGRVVYSKYWAMSSWFSCLSLKHDSKEAAGFLHSCFKGILHNNMNAMSFENLPNCNYKAVNSCAENVTMQVNDFSFNQYVQNVCVMICLIWQNFSSRKLRFFFLFLPKAPIHMSGTANCSTWSRICWLCGRSKSFMSGRIFGSHSTTPSRPSKFPIALKICWSIYYDHFLQEGYIPSIMRKFLTNLA